MREWLTAREIAEEALPDFPATEGGVLAFARRAGWDDQTALRRMRSGKGGGVEYSIHQLPSVPQVSYRQKHMLVSTPTEPAPAPAVDALSGRAAKERDARLAVVAAFEQFSCGSGLSFSSRVQVFVDKYNAGTIEAAAWVREIVPTASKRTLLRWRSKTREGNKAALGHDRAKARAGTGTVESANGGALRTFVLALIVQLPEISAQQVRDQALHEFGGSVTVASRGVERQVDLPPVRTFQHAMKSLKARHKVELAQLTNPDLYRSSMAPTGTGMLREVTEANQLWMIDASPVDALCLDGRHSIYGCIDFATRRTIWLMSKTPRASAVAMLMRKAILAWGAPDAVKTDNGSDFVARDTQRFFESLKIEPIVCRAYSPTEKAHIERAIGTMQRDCIRLMPGFVGHSVADRKRIEGRKSFAQRMGEDDAALFKVSLSASDMASLVDRWASSIYANRPHDGLHGNTPALAAMQSRRAVAMVDVRALDLLVMPAAGGGGFRVTTKQGIRIDGRFYMTPNILPGTSVFVRQDPQDLGRALLFAQDGELFLGEATCPALSGVDPAAFVAATKAAHRELLAERTREVRAEVKRLAKGPSLIERALDVNERMAPNVVALPRRQEQRSTPQIAAALDAMTPPAPVVDHGLDARRRQLAEQMQRDDEAAARERVDAIAERHIEQVEAARLAQFPAEVAVLPESPKDRYRRAVAAQRALAAGCLSQEEAHWLGRYENGAEFRAQAVMHEFEGEAYLG